MTAIRVRAGQTVSITTTPASTSGTFTAIAHDAVGRPMDATAAVDGTDVVISVAADEWADGTAGLGRVELKQVVSGVTSFPFAASLRILPGLAAAEKADRYA